MIVVLCYFMVKVMMICVIFFDVDEVFCFEGDLGLYFQYLMVWVKNILCKFDEVGLVSQVSVEVVGEFFVELWFEDFWDLIFMVGQIQEVVECVVDMFEFLLIV